MNNFDESKHPRDKDGKFSIKSETPIRKQGLYDGAGSEKDNFTHIKREGFINIYLHGKLPGYQKAVISVNKFENYALIEKDKAIAFKEALGYTVENAKDLILNIKENLGNFEAK